MADDNVTPEGKQIYIGPGGRLSRDPSSGSPLGSELSFSTGLPKGATIDEMGQVIGAPRATGLPARGLPTPEEQALLTHSTSTSEGPFPVVPIKTKAAAAPQVPAIVAPKPYGLQTPEELYQTRVGATRFAGEEGAPGTKAPVVFTNSDLAGSPWKGSPSGKGGLDTGGVDIDAIMSKFAGGGGTATGTGLPMPTGGGLFSALLSIATALGNARTARADEATRWHRGVDMAKLATDALEKTREYGMKAPYYGALGEHAMAGADLARKQGSALEVKPEAVMRKEHASAVERAYEVERKNNVEPDEARRNAWAMADEQFPDLPSVKARRGNGRDIAPLREWFKTGLGTEGKKLSDQDAYATARKSGWSDQEITAAGGKVVKASLDQFAKANPHIPKEKLQAAYNYYARQRGYTF